MYYISSREKCQPTETSKWDDAKWTGVYYACMYAKLFILCSWKESGAGRWIDYWCRDRMHIAFIPIFRYLYGDGDYLSVFERELRYQLFSCRSRGKLILTALLVIFYYTYYILAFVVVAKQINILWFLNPCISFWNWGHIWRCYCYNFWNSCICLIKNLEWRVLYFKGQINFITKYSVDSFLTKVRSLTWCSLKGIIIIGCSQTTFTKTKCFLQMLTYTTHLSLNI